MAMDGYICLTFYLLSKTPEDFLLSKIRCIYDYKLRLKAIILYNIYQSLHSCRIWHKVNF